MRNITLVRNLRTLVVNYRLTEWFAKQIVREFADPDVVAILNKSYKSLAQKLRIVVFYRDLPVTKVDPTFRVGGFANVHRAELYGRPVAIKMPRWYVRASTDTSTEDNRKLKVD